MSKDQASIQFFKYFKNYVDLLNPILSSRWSYDEKYFFTGFVSASDSLLFYSNSLQPLFKIYVSIVFEEIPFASKSKKITFNKLSKVCQFLRAFFKTWSGAWN